MATTSQQKLFLNLEKMAEIEKQIDDLGFTSAGKIKELSKRMAKLNRHNLAILAQKVFS